MINRGKLAKTKKYMTPKRGYACKYCGGKDHYAFACYNRPRKPIPVESKESQGKRNHTRRAWFRANKPDKDGYWPCYLQIADDCLKRVTTATIDLEHVLSKARHPKLKFRHENIKPACQPCNKLKRSWSLEDLAETYPQIERLLADPEFASYYQSIKELEATL